MDWEKFFENPWVITIGSGFVLHIFEAILSSYKEKKISIGHVDHDGYLFLSLISQQLKFHKKVFL